MSIVVARRTQALDGMLERLSPKGWRVREMCFPAFEPVSEKARSKSARGTAILEIDHFARRNQSDSIGNTSRCQQVEASELDNCHQPAQAEWVMSSTKRKGCQTSSSSPQNQAAPFGAPGISGSSDRLGRPLDSASKRILLRRIKKLDHRYARHCTSDQARGTCGHLYRIERSEKRAMHTRAPCKSVLYPTPRQPPVTFCLRVWPATSLPTPGSVAVTKEQEDALQRIAVT